MKSSNLLFLKLFVTLLFSSCLCHTFILGNHDLDSLLNQLKTAQTSTQRIEIYCSLASHCINVLDRQIQFDSLSKKAIIEAEKTYDSKIILKANLNYLKNKNSSTDSIYVQRIINRTVELNEKLEFEDQFDHWIIISKSYLKIFNYKKAHSFASKAFSFSVTSRVPIQIIKAQLTLGECALFKKQFIDAFRYFINSSYEIELLDDLDVRKKYRLLCHENLYKFHQKLENYDEAVKYKNLIIDYYKKQFPTDSAILHNEILDLLIIDLQQKKYNLLGSKVDKIWKYALKNDHYKLKKRAISFYRKLYIETNNFEKFSQLYENHPEELINLKANNLSQYYRALAYLNRYNNNGDSIEHYFNLAEKALSGNINTIHHSNFHFRYGEQLFQNNQIDKAYKRFLTSYNFAKEREHLPHLVASLKMLDTISTLNDNYRDGYSFQRLLNDCYQKKISQSYLDKLLLIKLDNEAKQLDIKQKRSRDDQKKKHNLQYFIITVAIVIIFLGIIILSHIAIPEWLIRTMGFMGVLMLFEFIILLLDHSIHHLTHGAPLYIFIIKIVLLSILFPLHHLIEKRIIKYLIIQKRLRLPKASALKDFALELWPWLKNN